MPENPAFCYLYFFVRTNAREECGLASFNWYDRIFPFRRCIFPEKSALADPGKSAATAKTLEPPGGICTGAAWYNRRVNIRRKIGWKLLI